MALLFFLATQIKRNTRNKNQKVTLIVLATIEYPNILEAHNATWFLFNELYSFFFSLYLAFIFFFFQHFLCCSQRNGRRWRRHHLCVFLFSLVDRLCFMYLSAHFYFSSSAASSSFGFFILQQYFFLHLNWNLPNTQFKCQTLTHSTTLFRFTFSFQFYLFFASVFFYIFSLLAYNFRFSTSKKMYRNKHLLVWRIANITNVIADCFVYFHICTFQPRCFSPRSHISFFLLRSFLTVLRWLLLLFRFYFCIPFKWPKWIRSTARKSRATKAKRKRKKWKKKWCAYKVHNEPHVAVYVQFILCVKNFKFILVWMSQWFVYISYLFWSCVFDRCACSHTCQI